MTDDATPWLRPELDWRLVHKVEIEV